MSELKPCPFCGGEAKFVHIFENPEKCMVSCRECDGGIDAVFANEEAAAETLEPPRPARQRAADALRGMHEISNPRLRREARTSVDGFLQSRGTKAGRERERMIHELKIDPKYFSAVRSGEKRFELRRNDRNFRVGDYLALNEYDRTTKTYTGRSELVQVIYMLNPNDVMTCPAGFAVMSISRESECDSVREEATQ